MDDFFKRFQLMTFGLIAFGLVLFSGCTQSADQHGKSSELSPEGDATQEDSLRKVKFLPYWVVNAQFAGYYVGLELGIYRKYGIDLEIIPYQPFITSNDLIRNGEVDFAAIWLTNAIELKATGADIVNIAQPSTQSSLMLITKKKSGINTLKQMDGKKAGIWTGFDLQPKALFSKHQLDVKIIPIGSTNNLFLKDGVDITIANWFDEYHSILNTGLDQDEMNTFFFKDYGLNFLEDGIYCMSALRRDNPDLCTAFINATFESWEYAFTHPDETLDIVIQYAKAAKIPVNRVHQQWMLDRYRDLYMPPGRKNINTKLHQSDYETIGKILLEEGMIETLPPFETFFNPVIKD